MDLGPYSGEKGADQAAALDAADLLAPFRDEFLVADPDLIYLDGNSLGRLPKAAGAVADAVVNHQWGDRLIRSWGEGWWELQLRLGSMLAPLIGANTDEVIVSNSTSTNCFKLAAAALGARPGRPKIVTDDLNFPSDLYLLQGLTRTLDKGHIIDVVETGDDAAADLVTAIDESTALVTLSHTTFKSSYTYDLAAITQVAHTAGALVLFDLSHSVGVVEIDLAAADVDLAVGCTYKYLNGGPGSPAFLYVRRDLHDQLVNPIWGWWGHAEPFAFDLDFTPVAGIRRFHSGTMPIVSLAVLEPGIEITARATLPAIRAKSVAQTEFLIEMIDEHLAQFGFTINSPRDSSVRGSHVSLTHDSAWQITQALTSVGNVIPDFRAPDNLRLGIAPLYTSFEEIHTAVIRTRNIVQDGVHLTFSEQRTAVT